MAKKQPDKVKASSSASGEQAVLWTSLGVVALLVAGFVLLSRPKAPEAQPAVVPSPGASVEAPAAPAPSQAKAPKASAPDSNAAPDFALDDVMTGKSFRLSEHKGKVVLIDFWATWCGPCRMAIPHLIELQKQYKGQGFQVVGISLDQQGPAVVKPFYQQWKMNYAVVIDSQGSAARDYGGIRSIPTAVLVGRDGRVITGFVGYRPKEEFEKVIKAALAAKS